MALQIVDQKEGFSPPDFERLVQINGELKAGGLDDSLATSEERENNKRKHGQGKKRNERRNTTL
ncbi:hypothetical protein NPIL_366481, partial [Nephila pilipes]